MHIKKYRKHIWIICVFSIKLPLGKIRILNPFAVAVTKIFISVGHQLLFASPVSFNTNENIFITSLGQINLLWVVMCPLGKGGQLKHIQCQ